MVNTIISIPGYVHLYRSLLRFYDMPENEVREMLYLLNTANLDCYEYYHPDRRWGPDSFRCTSHRCLHRKDSRAPRRQKG